MAESFSGGTRYRIDESHPAVAAALVAAGAASPEVRAMLRVLEETIPIQRIWLDTAEQKETPRTAFAAQPPSAVTDVMSIVYTNFRSVLGLSAHEAKARLLRTEPFHNFLALVEALPDEQ
jgi:hypothetical protein